MSQGNAFKTYQRGRRQYDIDTNFSGGMMFTKGAVEANYVKTLVNYDIQNNGDTLVPRPGLRISELILPDLLSEVANESLTYHTATDVNIVAAKECVEHGEVFRQIILGRHTDAENSMLYVLTAGEATAHVDEENFKVDVRARFFLFLAVKYMAYLLVKMLSSLLLLEHSLLAIAFIL